MTRTIQIVLDVHLQDSDPRSVDDTANLIMRALPVTPAGHLHGDGPPVHVEFIDAGEIAP